MKKEAFTKTTRYKCQCLRCGYEWVTRSEVLPKNCPGCKNPGWAKERKAKRGEK